MSFNTALSGLNAAQSDMSVTSHNIANVNTTGFKESRAQFGDIFANSTFGRNARTAIGTGVLLSRVAQQFSQGNLDFTSNNLDLAIAGDGFFVVSPNLGNNQLNYTRAGAFGVNKDGFVVSGTGQLLRTFPVNPDGTVTSTALTSTVPLQLPATAGVPTATGNITLGINLSANASAKDPALFNPTIPSTYSASTSVTIYDSFGNSHIASYYYIKDSTAAPGTNSWEARVYIDGVATSPVGDHTMTFDQLGVMTSPQLAATIPYNYNNGSAPATINIRYGGNTTQLAGTSSDTAITVNSLSQDGFATGQLTGVEISETGVVRANYTNGQSVALGKVALARFTNVQGLSQQGNTTWQETIDSGPAIAGEAGSNTFGALRSGALETSNVDLTKELVDLITAQRNFQANARAIETNNAITQTVIQIR